MAKYELNIKVSFETEKELPEVSMKGNMGVIETFFEKHVPYPGDVAEKTTVGEVSLAKIV